MDVARFQLYLLSKMRAAGRVEAAAAALGATPRDFPAVNDEAVRVGFETTGHAAQLYRDVLGAPLSSEPATGQGSEKGSFAGSLSLRFPLSSWPEFDFVVNEAPAGFAWGRRFVRRVGVLVPSLTRTADLEAWRFVSSEVTGAFGAPRSEDAWSDWEDLSYLVPESDQTVRRSRLGFDLDLLQLIAPLAP